jgi:hypothetical protein
LPFCILLANALILWLGYYWLGIGESRTSTLLWSALVHFRDDGHRATGSWKTAALNLPPLMPAFRIASWLTLTLRTPVRPAAVARIFSVILWIVRWAALPAFLLPEMSAVAAFGWQGFRRTSHRVPGLLYWIEVPLLLLCLIRVPLWLFYWVPEVNGFGMQAASFTARIAVAYLLFGASWPVLAFVTSRGKPRPAQSSTADSP